MCRLRLALLAVLVIHISVFVPECRAIDPVGMQLEHWLKLYRQLDLPIPPSNSGLVAFETRQTPWLSLAILSSPSAGGGSPGIFRRFREASLNPLWKPRSLQPAEALELSFLPFDDALNLAVQCYALGWTKLAKKVWLENSGVLKRHQLYLDAWNQVDEQIVTAADRKAVVGRLKLLLSLEPDLNTWSNTELVRCLDLSVLPRIKPGGVFTAVIDALVEYRRIPEGDPETPEYWRLVEAGFEAVPNLLRHVEDQRVTRERVGSEMGRSREPRVFRHVLIKDICIDILNQLSDLDGCSNCRYAPTPKPFDEPRFEKWWAHAREMGEEKYLATTALKKSSTVSNSTQIYLTHILLTKYPKYFEAVNKAVANDELHVRLESLVCWWQAFRSLAKADPKLFDTLLSERIVHLPAHISDPYRLCNERRLAELVIETSNPRIWKEFELAARRTEPGLRMEFLAILGDSSHKGQTFERLRFLMAFLTDTFLRDRSTSFQYNGPCAGSDYHRIEVRDFAALQICRLLKSDVPYEVQRSAAEWTDVRDRARRAAERKLNGKG
jgi:hypothetical protein